jgi:hypothetical protein
MTHEIIKEKNLAPNHDPGTIAYYLPKDEAKKFDIT